MNKKSNELYISDVTEDEKLSYKSGDAQAIVAEGCKEEVKKEKVGNQVKEYYVR